MSLFLEIILTKEKLLLAFRAIGNEGAVTILLDDAAGQQIFHQLVGVIAFHCLLLDLCQLKVKLVYLGLLRAQHIISIMLFHFAFLDLSLGATFLAIDLQEVRTDSFAYCINMGE